MKGGPPYAPIETDNRGQSLSSEADIVPVENGKGSREERRRRISKPREIEAPRIRRMTCEYTSRNLADDSLKHPGTVFRHG